MALEEEKKEEKQKEYESMDNPQQRAMDRRTVIRHWLRADSAYLIRTILFCWKSFTFSGETEPELEVYSPSSAQPVFSHLQGSATFSL